MAQRILGQRNSLRRLLLAVLAGGLCLGLFREMGPVLGTTVALFAMLGVLRWQFLLAFPIVYLAVLVPLIYFMESYLPIAPSIDTRYAPGYSEGAFDQLAPGDSAEAVRRALGEPLSVVADRSRQGREVWWYTADGKCSWWDFAWLGRNVTIERGRVVSVGKQIWYD